MKTDSIRIDLCTNTGRKDAVCRKLKRCSKCCRVLAFVWPSGLCPDCERERDRNGKEAA